MDQITASVVRWTDMDGKHLMITHYVGDCGCRWQVDMWGNVRRVEVCDGCNSRESDWERQLSLLADLE